ncbi:MAG TPA: hypothetical protein VNZ45_04860, partial [Bacteroidia bacterium]|nr:hypothetical protein [Bacteroidia bacterium]
ATICPNAAPIQLTGTPTGGTFSGAGVSGNYFYPTTVPAGITQITYNLNDACGSNYINYANVVPVKPTIAPNKISICVGDAITFTASTGATQYSFYKNKILVQGPSASNTYSTTQLGNGDSIFVAIIKSGCMNYSDTISIPVNPNPVVSFTISDYCAGKFANTFTSTTTISYGTSTVSNVQWYMDIGTGYSAYYPSGNSVSHLFAAAGTHAVRSIVTLSTGCSNLKDSSIFMGDYPHAKFSWKTACGSEVVNLTDSSYIQQVGSSITQWSWDYQNDNIYDLVGATSSNSYNYSAFGNYYVKLKVKTNYGCADSTTTKVTIQPTVTPTITNPYNEQFKLNDGSWSELGSSSTW